MGKKKKQLNLNLFKKQILNNKLPIYFYKSNLIKTDSWFDIQKQRSLFNHANIDFKKDVIEETIISATTYEMILTETQKKIIDKWFDCYTEMYNEALKYIRSKYPLTKHDIIRETFEDDRKKHARNEEFYNTYYIRNNLTAIKKNIQERSTLNVSDSPNKRIFSHTLDYAVQQLCANIKTSKENLISGFIKKFRLKYWKNKRPSKSMDFEKTCFNKDNKFCFQQLGDMIYKYNNEEIILPPVESGVKVNYNSITNKYTLIFPIKNAHIIDEHKSNNSIYLDPGLRTFMTGISENSNLKIANNVNYIMSKLKNKELEIKNNPKIKARIKRKNLNRIQRKITDKVKDLHWKTISFLVKNFNGIFLGDMSAKDVVRGYTLSKSQKRAVFATQYYTFQQRLAFKCKQYGVTYKLVDESYTSKMCSICGNQKNDLRGSHIYDCKKCLTVLDRDLNGARNIYIKTLL